MITAPAHSLHRLVAFVTLCLVAAPVLALEPDEIALVVARGNRESIGLARYYCKQRGVPENHLIEVDLPPGERMEREQWRWAVRPEIKKWLDTNDPERKLRCLVTTWGVPLRIERAEPDDDAKAYIAYLEAERDSRLESLAKIRTALDGLAGGSSVGAAVASLPETDEGISLNKAKEQLESALRAAQQRIGAMSSEDRRLEEARVQQLAAVAGGGRVLLQGIAQQMKAREAAGVETPPALQRQFDVLRGRVSAFTEGRQLLEGRPPSFERDWLTLRMLEQSGGLLATVEWLDKELQGAKRNQTIAAFDSELSLVLWPDGYELLRWQPNYLRTSYAGTQLPTAFPTLMVARIDGPTLPIAKRLIDDAIAVEEQGGLFGPNSPEAKIYLDARGLTTLEGPPHDPGTYEDYDRTLLATARGLESLKDADGEPRFDVVLDSMPDLFQPGQCPDAGLYCGWYSLAKYVDAFEWRRGAVAYHMASGELETLKELDSQAWCKELLKDGVAATIGPVHEPYLLAFPRPSEFFALLVQGDLPLVEVYYRTKPFNSWAMSLIGDPLYRPFPK